MITLAAADTLAAGASVASKLTSTVFGMELSGTTETYKVLDQRQLAASPATIYTVPGSTTAFVKTITVVNNDTSVRTFQYFRGGTAQVNSLTPVLSIPAGGMAVYEDGCGWSVLNSDGQLLQAGAGIRPGGYDIWAPSPGLYETMDRNVCTETNTSLLSSGRLSLQAIWLPAGITINSISFWSATTAGATLTNQLFGLYDNNLNLLSVTSNDTTTAWAANAKKTLNLTTAFQTTYSGIHYLAIMVAATTVPTMKGGTARTGGQLASAAPSMGGTSNTGLTTTLPATATAPGTVTTTVWGCVNG
jgi:hypothetical protein